MEYLIGFIVGVSTIPTILGLCWVYMQLTRPSKKEWEAFHGIKPEKRNKVRRKL